MIDNNEESFLPRKEPKNNLCANSRLSRGQFEILLMGWCKDRYPEEVVEKLDEEYPDRRGKHVIGKDAVVEYYRDFGDFLWVTFGYEVCAQAFVSLKGESVPTRYPNIDPYVRELVATAHKVLTRKDALSSEVNSMAMRVLQWLLFSEGGNSLSPAAAYLDMLFKMANGFSLKKTHAYLSKAIFVRTSIGDDCSLLEFDAFDKEISSATTHLYYDMLARLEKFRLRQNLNSSCFPWGNDGWMRNFKS